MILQQCSRKINCTSSWFLHMEDTTWKHTFSPMQNSHIQSSSRYCHCTFCISLLYVYDLAIRLKSIKKELLSRKFLGDYILYNLVCCKSHFAKDSSNVSINMFHFRVPSLIFIWISKKNFRQRLLLSSHLKITLPQL
jgi:hypothetical protein